MTLQPLLLTVQAVDEVGNLVSLAFMIAIAALAVNIVVRLFRKKPVRRVAVAAIACVTVYAILLITLSLSSRTRELTPGTEKCFDDWCATVTKARSLPGRENSDLKLVGVSFEVSNHAQRAAFRPSQPRVSLVAPDGRAYMPSSVAQREFEQQAGRQEDLARRLTAGEQFQTTLVFEVPPETRKGWIVLQEGPAAITRFLIGDENSFLHAKLVFPVEFD